MQFLLDTNVVFELRKANPHGGVAAWISALTPSDVCISAVTVGEAQAGVERTRKTNPAKATEIETWLTGLCSELTVLPADDAVFRLWSRLRVGRQNHSFADSLIGATALHHGLTVATRNVEDFMPFGVLVTNPFGKTR